MFPVANLNFKFLAWHVCLEFFFDKNRYYESVLVFLLNFLRRFGKFQYSLQNFFKNSFTGFQKSWSIEKPPTFLCARILSWIADIFMLGFFFQISVFSCASCDDRTIRLRRNLMN